MKDRRKKERRSMADRRLEKPGRRFKNEMGCFTADECRRVNVSDRRNDERRLFYRRTKD